MSSDALQYLFLSSPIQHQPVRILLGRIRKDSSQGERKYSRVQTDPPSARVAISQVSGVVSVSCVPVVAPHHSLGQDLRSRIDLAQVQTPNRGMREHIWT